METLILILVVIVLIMQFLNFIGTFICIHMFNMIAKIFSNENEWR